MRRHELLKGSPSLGCLAPVSEYDVSALNIHPSPETIIDSVEQFLEGASWDEPRPGNGLNLLFWGLPGTGKTEFARYLAHRLGTELIVKRASQLLNCFVGETEKNIARAFQEAARDRAILFLDEADSFFAERQNSRQSWEVTQTNELLQQMEQFPGVLICCTNLLGGLDRAALRRFAFKIEFKPLASATRLSVYTRYFRDLAPVSPTQLERLQAVEGLTFGDILAVHKRLRFSRAPLEHATILSELELEADYRDPGKGNRMGFDCTR